METINYEKEVETHLPTTLEKCRKDARWALLQSVELLIRLRREEQLLYFELKKKYPDLPSEVISLIASLQAVYYLRRVAELRYINIEDVEDLREIESFRIQKHKKKRKRPQWTWLNNHQSDLKTMIRSQYSSYDMKHYFYEVYHIRISHTLIIRFIKAHKELSHAR